MDCHICIHSELVAGSAHFICKHPLNDNIFTSRGALVALLTLAAQGCSPLLMPEALNLKLSPIGIKGGWCTYPFDFDRIWILNCDGFEKKDNGTQKNSKETSRKDP